TRLSGRPHNPTELLGCCGEGCHRTIRRFVGPTRWCASGVRAHMTTRDSRSRDPRRPASQSGSGRDPTQSLEVDLIDDVDVEPAEPEELARGTHDRTKAESPSGRLKPPSGSGGRRAPVLQADDPEAYIGTTLGTYRIDQLLGKGGMGYVYRAEH